MANEDQSPNTFTHGETGMFRTNIEETSKVIEDTEVVSEQEDPSTPHQGTQAEDPSVDAVMGLRVTLENLRQQIARAVVAGATQEDLLKLQERAVNIQNCIKFLDEAQAFCVPPHPSTNDATFSSGISSRNPHPRLDHLIPSDLPVWHGRPA
ncbi:hypothetical protein G6F33_014006 [Rhizopus arrhizus]|nr:hypothetical protein G6F33_014006 [Rhizopus arrhizus]